MKYKWNKLNLILCILFSFTFHFNNDAFCNFAKWPDDLVYSEKIFRPDGAFAFSDWENVEFSKFTTDDPNQFSFLKIKWKEHLPCGEPSRGRGFVHTDPVILSAKKDLSVAIPLKVLFDSDFVHEKKREILTVPLVKVSVLWLNSKNMSLYDIQSPEYFTLESIYRESTQFSNQLDVPLRFNYEGIMTTQPITIPAGTNYRIRVDWSADGICDEKQIEFAVGDQIRMLRTRETF